MSGLFPRCLGLSSLRSSGGCFLESAYGRGPQKYIGFLVRSDGVGLRCVSRSL
jgi:hypothetical protein